MLFLVYVISCFHILCPLRHYFPMFWILYCSFVPWKGAAGAIAVFRFPFLFSLIFLCFVVRKFLYLVMSLFIARIKWLWCVYIPIILDMHLSLQYSNYLGLRLSFAVPASTFCLQFSCWGFSVLYYQGSFLFLSLESFKFVSIRTIRKTLNQSCILTSKSLLYCLFRYSEVSDKM